MFGCLNMNLKWNIGNIAVMDKAVKKVKHRLCIEKQFNGKPYITTHTLRDIERNMGDIMLELYGDDIVGEEEHFDDFDDETYNKIIASYQKRRGLSLTNRQKQAVRKCLVHRFHTVCGYPGTGKTTITEAACTYLKQQNPDMNICLTSHTGLATKNLKKAIDKQLYKEKLVATLTKLIYSTFPRIIQDQKTKEYGDEDAEYADCAPDLIIVDEISMVDMQLFYELLQWCKKFNFV